MRIGLIGRADNGGLGTMTAEFARHMRPDRTLVVDLGAQGRGRCHLERFTEFCPNVGIVSSWPQFDRAAADWLLRDVDVIYSAETWYWPEVQEMAAERGIKSVLHSMPELHSPDIKADAIWVPTSWEIDRIPGATLMPVPVARDRFPVRDSTKASSFLHVAASAMLDRNGTNSVLAALPLIQTSIDMNFRGLDGQLENPGNAATPNLLSSPKDYWDVTAGADVLVYPRRYAGLSLPMQEAMARGMPIIATDLSPQRDWPGVHVIAAYRSRTVDMKGGQFRVWDCNPDELAAAIDEVASDPGLYRDLADGAAWYAESISWSSMTAKYVEEFGRLA